MLDLSVVLSVAALILTASPASAQGNWVDADMPGRTPGSLRLRVDPELGLMCIGNITETNNFAAPIIPCYQNGAWSILRGFRGTVTDALRFSDTLFVCGYFYAVVESDGDSIPVNNLAAYYDNGWHAIEGFEYGNGAIRRLKVLDNELYALGPFLEADGQLCHGVAKRVGRQWVPVGLLPLTFPFNAPDIRDAIIYQGSLYVCGTLDLAPNSADGIARFNGQDWEAPGGGLLGGGHGIAMAVYQDELYLGGSFSLGPGNAGHAIQKWNGSTWSAVGGHLRDANNTTSGAASCYSLFEHEGKLLAAGGFQYAGGVPAQTFGYWDGTHWCGTGDVISNGSHSIALYNDTIFLASGRWVNGDSTNTVVKWVSGAMQGSVCSEPVGMEEASHPSEFIISPNPASSSLTLNWSGTTALRYLITDGLGRTVRTGQLPPRSMGAINVGDLAAGLYHIREADQDNGMRTARFLKE